MAGPKTPEEARTWIREAAAARRYVRSVHFLERLAERGFIMLDVIHTLHSPSAVRPHPDPPRHGGTCWRLEGREVDGTRRLAVGVEAYLDDAGRAAFLCTVIDLTRRIR